MKIIFMGSSMFAVPSLAALIKSEHDVALVVTQCDKPSGRGLKIASCPIAAFAIENGLESYQPTSLKEKAVVEKLSKIKPDLIVVVAYGKFLPKNILDIPLLGCINVHASLLPKYRGAAPINWAIAKGEAKTGVTTMRLNEKMDAGDILLQEEVEIGATETATELYERLSILGASLLIETLDKLQTIKPRPQDESKATYAPIIKKSDGLIDWKKPATEILNLIRGMQPWPVAYTYLDGKMLKIFGAVKTAEKDTLAFATGDGTLYLTDVQLEGKKRMSSEMFLRGYKK